MIYESLEDRPVTSDQPQDLSKKSNSDEAIHQQDAAGQFPPPPHGSTGVVDRQYSGDQHGGWTDYSESEADEGPQPQSTRWQKAYGYPRSESSGYRANHSHPGSISGTSSIFNISQLPDKQVSRWTHQSQRSLLYESNQQLADVPEEFQEELTASIVGQHRESRFTLYKVVVQFGGRVWFVLRRYSDFALLNKKLQKQFPVFRFELPARRADRSKFNHAFIDERQHALDRYLKNLLIHQEFAQCTHVKRFLKLDDPPKIQADPEDVKMFCQALQQQNQFLQNELQAARVEIIALRGGKVPREPVDLKPTPLSQSMAYEEQLKEYQDALGSAKDAEQKTRRELEDLRREIKAESKGAKEASHEILKRREDMIRKQMENFDRFHVSLDEQLNTMCNKDAPDSGQEGKDTVSQKEAELKQIFYDWETKLRNNHQEIVEAFAREIEELKFHLAKKSEVIKAKDEEICQQRDESHQNKRWFNLDIKQKRDQMKTLAEQLKSAEKRCFYAEEQYFFALFVGAKLSISMSHHKKPSLNDIHPQELFEKVRNEGLAIKHWAGWIAKEMKL